MRLGSQPASLLGGITRIGSTSSREQNARICSMRRRKSATHAARSAASHVGQSIIGGATMVPAGASTRFKSMASSISRASGERPLAHSTTSIDGRTRRAQG